MLKITEIYLDYSPLRSGNITANNSPIISWSLASDTVSDAQMSYRLVMSDAQGEFFDSGIVADSEQSFVYNGQMLPQGQMITVKLTVDSQNGDTAGRTFEIFSGCIDFPNAWITHPDEKTGRRVLQFVKQISFEKAIESVSLYVCGLGYHKVEIDGSDVGETVLDPIHSDYSKVCYYSVIPDIQRYFVGKSPVISVSVAPGWRNIDSFHVKKYTGGREISFEGKTQLNAVIYIRYADGSEEKVFTDESWDVAYSQITETNIFDGETYNSEICELDFVSSVLCNTTCGEMRPMTVQGIKAHEIYKPVSMFKTGDDTYVFDFGQNIAGVCALPLYDGMKRGQRIKMKHAEVLDDESGELYTEPLRGAMCTDTYIASGDEEDTDQWIPQFTYHGFRYMQLEGYAAIPNKDDFTAFSLYSDVDKNAYFECGSPLVNRIHKNTLMCERSNIFGIFTDCPQRDERMGWMNDSTVRFEEAPYNFDVGKLLAKVVDDIYCTQSESGEITCTAPYVFGSRPADPVCSSYLIAAYQAYLHYGNTSVIDKYFDGFEKWETSLLERSDDYIVNYSYYGDWASPVYACKAPENAASSVTPGILMSTGYSYYNCVLLAKFAEITGRSEKKEYYSDISKRIAKAFNDKWVDKQTGKVADGSQGALAFALWLGILPQELRAKAAKMMRDDLVEGGYKITTGNLTTKYMLDMLAQYGYINEAWAWLNRTEYPSLGYEINQEATTVWERWELKRNPDMNSHNHPMYGACDYFLHAYLAGIKPTDIGFKRVSIKPYLPDGLDFCRDTLPTVYGDIQVKWVRRYGKRILYLTVPFGMTADVDFCDKKQTVTYGSYIITAD